MSLGANAAAFEGDNACEVLKAPQAPPKGPEVPPAVFEGDDQAAWEAMLQVMSRKPFEVGALTPLVAFGAMMFT